MSNRAQQRAEAKTGQQVVCERISERVAELLEPSTTREHQWRPSSDGKRLEQQPHVVVHPSLVVQLELAVESSTAGGPGGGGYESRPTANIQALDALGILEREAAIWFRVIVGAPAPRSIRRLLEQLVERAPTLTPERLRALDFDVLRWWARARIVTTWDTAPMKPHVPCMNCDRRGGLRVTLFPTAAVCLNCGAAWDATTIGILGEHIRLAMSPPPAIPDARDEATAEAAGAR